MKTLQANEVYEELIDGCFLNIWFVNSWDEMDLFVLNREVKIKDGNIIGYIRSYNTEYLGQGCGNSIENIEFNNDGVTFAFNEKGKKHLQIESLKIIYPANLNNKEAIEARINELINSADYTG